MLADGDAAGVGALAPRGLVADGEDAGSDGHSGIMIPQGKQKNGGRIGLKGLDKWWNRGRIWAFVWNMGRSVVECGDWGQSKRC